MSSATAPTEPLAFDPPAEEEATRSRHTGSVLLAWMASGAAIGMGLGTTVQLVRPDGMDAGQVATAMALGFPAVMLVAGWVALRVERSLAASRPAVPDARGELSRPLHVGLWAVPLGLALPALGLSVIVVSLATRSWLPAVLFGVGALGLGWGARRLLASHRLTRALEDLERGDIRSARAGLEALERGWVSTRNLRVAARLNLGLLDLADGELERAAGWYARVSGGPGAPLASAGLALVRVLQGRHADAEATLLQAMSDPRASLAQGQIDAVRVLLVLRTEGPSAARLLGDQLHHGDAGALLNGVLARARHADGDLAGARELLDPHTVDALESGGWAAVIPELAVTLADARA